MIKRTITSFDFYTSVIFLDLLVQKQSFVRKYEFPSGRGSIAFIQLFLYAKWVHVLVRADLNWRESYLSLLVPKFTFQNFNFTSFKIWTGKLTQNIFSSKSSVYKYDLQ